MALDKPSVEEALALTTIAGLVGMYKIGKQLHTAAGNEGVNIIGEIYKKSPDGNPNVFLDLKYHDIPQTVYGCSAESAVPGVSFFNIHVAGGEAMCKSALEGAYEGAEKRGIERPRVIGVTVLTSMGDNDLAVQGIDVGYDAHVMRMTELAKEWGLDGIVCAARVAGELERKFGSDFLYVTPGIKWAGKQGVGQKQLYTPDLAVRDCSSSILVIGSAITKASDKVQTTYDILQAMANEL